jgi:hypothetical protein
MAGRVPPQRPDLIEVGTERTTPNPTMAMGSPRLMRPSRGPTTLALAVLHPSAARARTDVDHESDIWRRQQGQHSFREDNKAVCS